MHNNIFQQPGEEPLIRGRFYTVICVRAYWPLREISGASPNWIPVIGPAHADNDAVNFPIHHWHADHRFLDFSRLNKDPRIYRHYKYFEQSEFCLENSAFRNPVIEIAPLNVPDDVPERHVKVSDLNPATYPEHTYLKLMILKYQGETQTTCSATPTTYPNSLTNTATRPSSKDATAHIVGQTLPAYRQMKTAS